MDKNSELEISDFLKYFLGYKKQIIITTLAFTLISGAISFVLTPKFKSSSLYYLKSESEAPNISGVASLLGMNTTGASDLGKISPILESNDLTESFIAKYDLIPQIFPELIQDSIPTEEYPSLRTASKVFKKNILEFDLSTKTSLLEISITFSDSLIAYDWTQKYSNHLISTLESLEKSKSDSIQSFYLKKIQSNSNPKFVEAIQNLYITELKRSILIGKEKFQIIDTAFIPEKAYFPNKKLFLVFGLLFGLFSITLLLIIKLFYFDSKDLDL